MDKSILISENNLNVKYTPYHQLNIPKKIAPFLFKLIWLQRLVTQYVSEKSDKPELILYTLGTHLTLVSLCRERERVTEAESDERAVKEPWDSVVTPDKTTGNDRGRKYLPLPGPRLSFGGITGPSPPWCWKECVFAAEGVSANNTALIIPWTADRMFLCCKADYNTL